MSRRSLTAPRRNTRESPFARSPFAPPVNWPISLARHLRRRSIDPSRSHHQLLGRSHAFAAHRRAIDARLRQHRRRDQGRFGHEYRRIRHHHSGRGVRHRRRQGQGESVRRADRSGRRELVRDGSKARKSRSDESGR